MLAVFSAMLFSMFSRSARSTNRVSIRFGSGENGIRRHLKKNGRGIETMVNGQLFQDVRKEFMNDMRYGKGCGRSTCYAYHSDLNIWSR